jgi:hypothetical protein
MNLFRAFMELDKINEDIFDNTPSSKLNKWVSATGQPIKLQNNTQVQTSQSSTTKAPTTNNKFIVRIVSDHGRLRAVATDGIHPGGWVAFPNDLRQFEGQTYEVDQLIWNGKNYRVSGNIVEI